MSSQRKLNIKGIHIAIGFVILIVIVGAAAWWNYTQGKEQSGDGYSLTIARDGQEIKTFTIEEIQSYPAIEVYADLQSAQHENAKGTFKGTDLAGLLNRADPSILKECTTFICIAGDGYSSAISQKELSKKNNILAVYQKDGAELIPFPQGGEGPMRLIIASDTYGNRSIKFLTRIECRK